MAAQHQPDESARSRIARVLQRHGIDPGTESVLVDDLEDVVLTYDMDGDA